MSVSHDSRASSRETRALPGDLGASGGAAPLGGDMAAAGAEGGSEESARESEAWAAAVPPVRPPLTQFVYFVPLLGSRPQPNINPVDSFVVNKQCIDNIFDAIYQ